MMLTLHRQKEEQPVANSLNSRSLARACSTLEAPIRVERAAERVAANTPTVIMGGRALMYWGEGGGEED